MRALFRLQVVVALLFAAHPGIGRSQSAPKRVVLPGRIACTSCKIELSRAARIGDNDGAGSFDRTPFRAHVDSKGRVYVTSSGGPGLAYMFDTTGRFLKRLGRIGSGPGEYRSSSVFKGNADSVTVLDLNQLRRSFLAPGGTFIKSVPMAVTSLSAINMPNGIQLVHFYTGFNVVNSEGRIVRQFGGNPKTSDRPNDPGVSSSVRMFASHGDLFWTAGAMSYAFDQWSLNGTKLVSFERPVAWFPRIENFSSGGNGTVPTPTVSTLYEDASGLLWTITRVAAANWKKGLGPATQVGNVTVYRKTRPDELYDAVIEAIDVSKGVVLQSLRVRGHFPFFVGDGLVAQYVEDDDFIPHLQLHHIRLRRTH